VKRVDVNLLLGDAVRDLKSESLLLRQSALNALKFYGRISQDKAKNIVERVASFENSGNIQEKEILDQLLFEFGLNN
jgi:parvulin-like peptidyl-prolyl isomerase